MVASSSGMARGADSSHSAGFSAAASTMSARSTQSAGLESVTSSISAAGMMGGSMSLYRDPEASSFPSMLMEKVASGRMTRVYRCDNLSALVTGGCARWCSLQLVVTGLRHRTIKCTLSVPPHLSGPNIMM